MQELADGMPNIYSPRPIQNILGFKTIAGTPNFPEKAALVRTWAEEAAISRLYGGIHWTFGAEIGTDQGRKIAQYTIDVAKSDGAD